jgi:hypothetical protein
MRLYSFLPLFALTMMVAMSDGSHSNNKRAATTLGDLEVVVQQLSEKVDQLSAT